MEKEEERDGESGRGLCWVCVCVCERLSAQKLHPQSSVFNSRHTDRRTESESSRQHLGTTRELQTTEDYKYGVSTR